MDLTWLGLVIPPLVIISSISVGVRLGDWYKKSSAGAEIAPVSSIVGASLGLFAFMLAFTFQMTASRFQNRKELFLQEIDAISAAYLKTGLLKDPYLTNCKKMIAEYVDVRVRFAVGTTSLQSAVVRSRQIQDSLWMQVETMAREGQSFASSFGEAVINVKELFTKRIVVGLYSRIPNIILGVLYLISFFSMLLLGFQFGISGKSSAIVIVALAIIFSTVMWLIFALDNPETRIIKVDQRAIFDLQQEVNNR